MLNYFLDPAAVPANIVSGVKIAKIAAIAAIIPISSFLKYCADTYEILSSA